MLMTKWCVFCLFRLYISKNGSSKNSTQGKVLLFKNCEINLMKRLLLSYTKTQISDIIFLNNDNLVE